MIRPLTVETVCFEILLAALAAALAAWVWGMVRKSFGSIPAVLRSFFLAFRWFVLR